MIGVKGPNPQITSISKGDVIHTEDGTYTILDAWNDVPSIPYDGGVKARTESGYVTFIPYRTIKTCDCGNLTITDSTCPSCYR